MKQTLLAALLFVPLTLAAADAPLVPYPEGYRNWHHVKSMVIQPGHPLHAAFGGIHHLYANSRALEGYRQGRFKDGSVIIFDLLDTVPADNAITEGERKVVGVMHRDSKRYSATGGWGFEGFAGNSKTKRAVGGNAVKACYECHTSQKDKQFIFSTLRN